MHLGHYCLLLLVQLYKLLPAVIKQQKVKSGMHNNILQQKKDFLNQASYLIDFFVQLPLCLCRHLWHLLVFALTSILKEKGPLRRRAQVRYNGVKVFSKVVFSYLFTDVFAKHVH